MSETDSTQAANAGQPGRGDGGAAPQVPSSRRRLRPLRLLLEVTVSFTLALVLMLGLVLGTQTGLRLAFGLAEELAPGILRVERVDGRILGRLHLSGLALRLPDFAMDAGSVDLDWSPFSAIGGTLPVSQLVVQDLDLVLPPSPDEPKEPLRLPNIALPLQIDVGEARVERVRLFRTGETSPFVQVDRADLSASLRGSELTLAHLGVALTEPRLDANAAGKATLRDGYPLALDLDWELTQAPAMAVHGAARIAGDREAIQLSHRLSGSARADLDVRVADPLGDPAWDGRLEILAVDLPDFRPDLPKVAITGLLQTDGNLDLAQVTGRVDARAPDLPDFGHLSVVLDLSWAEQALKVRALELTEQASQALLTLTGEIALGPDPGGIALAGHWERLRWPLSGDPIAESPRGKVDVSGTFDAFDYALSLVAQGPDIPSLNLGLAGEGSRTGTRLSALRLDALGGELLGEGELSWSPELTWAVRLDGADLDPAGLVEGLDDRVSLRLTTSGGLDGFDYGVEARSVGPGLPPSSLQIGGRGDARQARLETLILETLGGRIQGQAEVGWDPQVTWTAAVDAEGIDPGTHVPAWPGRIDARITSRGSVAASELDLVAAIERFEGDLRGYPIRASGQVSMVGERIRVEDFSAASGPSLVRVQGTIDEALDLNFDLESPDLATLLPEARGSLKASGTVSGTRDMPQALVDLSASEAELAGQGIKSLSGRLDLGLSPDGPFEIQLDGRELVVGDMLWSTLSVRGEGRMPDHRFAISLAGEPLSLMLDGSGALGPEGAYAGRIIRLDLASKTFGDWGLREPSPFSIDGPRIGAGPLCIRGPAGSGGCVELSQDEANRRVASLDLDLADLALLAPVLPETLTLAGNGRLRGRFEAAGAVLTGDASAEFPTGSVRIPIGAGKEEVVEFSGARLSLDADARALAARLGVPLSGMGQIDGRLELPGWRLDAPTRPGQPIGGTLRASIEGLDRISHLVPDLNAVTGAVDVDLGLAGTLGEPGVKGGARVSRGGFEVPLIGLKVSGLNLSAKARRLDELALQGEADVGGGRLGLTGDVRFGGGGFDARARLSGDQLKVADTREYFALVSPDLDLQADSTGARLSGEIKVPEARIRPRSLPAGTKSTSSDVVLGDGASAPPYPLEIDLRLHLGDQVTIDSFGVRGRLAGDLTLLQSPGREMLGDGQLQIIDGQYRLAGGFGLAADIGVPLNIVQGRLVFAQSPVGNPGLLLQAEREGGSTTAGVRVMGTMRDPKLTFFSESDPGMTQAEITKYLLTGIAPTADDKGPDPGLAVGTYIAPKIFLEYETGLGDQQSTVRLRYDLTNRIELQTETGESQGADVFFTFER